MTTKETNRINEAKQLNSFFSLTLTIFKAGVTKQKSFSRKSESKVFQQMS
jgi:hypothetical protein